MEHHNLCERLTPYLPLNPKGGTAPAAKNPLEFRGEITVLFVNDEQGHTREVLIDTEDLPKVRGIKWKIIKNRNSRHVYCRSGSKIMHRLVMNAPKGLCVDHIHHNTLDNRKSQLRLCTNQENSLNRAGPGPNNTTSGVRGVHLHKASGKWRVQLWRYRRIHDLGLFADKDEAISAVQSQLRKWGVPQ